MILILLLVVSILLLLYVLCRKPKNFPPGPPRFPLLGELPFLSRHLPHKQFRDFSHKYGPIVGIFIGSRPCVLLNSHETIKEGLMNDDLLGRPTGHLVTSRTWDQRLGVLFTEGPFWVSQRRFTLHQFRNLGFGKRSHELVILEDVADMVEEIKQLKGPFSLQKLIGISSINILWAIMGGTSFKRDDPKLQVLVQKINKLFQSGSPFGNLAAALPILRPLVAEYTGYNDIVRGFVSVRDFIMESVEEHKKTLNKDEVRDFFDAYLIELENSTDPSFTEQQLVALCMDIFAAGVETSSSLVSFCILFMCLHPEVQTKVQEELDSVVGRSRLPCLDDRANLSYTDATYMEVFRYRCPAVTTVPHIAMKDTILQNYHIPKGTMVLPNLYAVFMDPNYWGDPETFRPERFLDDDGKVKKEERFFPFGKGKRNCLGESLARMTTFLTFTSLLQNFSFKIDQKSFNNDTEGTSGFTLGPPYFEVLATPREY